MYETIQKTLIAWAFNNYIAHYFFDNVTVNQLKVAFEEGQIELQDLPLKCNALEHLKVPWNVVTGLVGNLSIKLPLLALLTDPWQIKITDLRLIVSPGEKKDQNQDEKNETMIRECLDEGEINSEEIKLAGFYSSFSSMVSTIVRDIYKNLRLEIESITIKFERFDHRVKKISCDKILFHRPTNYADHRIVIENMSLYFSCNYNNLIRIDLDPFSLDIKSVASENNNTSLEFKSEDDTNGYVFIDDLLGSPSIPVSRFLLEDFRMLYFSEDQQQDYTMFARISCSYFDCQSSSWNSLLKPWPFNLSWDRRTHHKKISLTSDELAEFTVSSPLLDLIDIVIKRVCASENSYTRQWRVSLSPIAENHTTSSQGDSPKKAFESSPKLCHYIHSTNLAQQICNRTVRQLFKDYSRENILDVSFISPGLKIVLVDNTSEKILELLLDSVVITSSTRSKEQIVDCSIQEVRISNAMQGSEKNIVLDRATPLDESINPGPALRLIVDRMIGKSFGTTWFRQVQLSTCELLLNIEERLFLKLVEFVSLRKIRRFKRDHLTRDLDKLLHPQEDRSSRYYFDLLRIDLTSLKLSCFTSLNLPSSLQKLKNSLGLKFFGFEDAQVQLSPYFRMNVSKNLRGISESLARFYKRQILDQAPRIVGQQIQNYLRFHLSDLLSSLYDEVYYKLFY